VHGEFNATLLLW